MNRTFSERKPKKFDAKNKENETIIRALYMYGRVPEQWELLNEIERLNNIINESAEEILKELEENHHLSYGVALAIRQKLLDYKELKGSDK